MNCYQEKLLSEKNRQVDNGKIIRPSIYGGPVIYIRIYCHFHDAFYANLSPVTNIGKKLFKETRWWLEICSSPLDFTPTGSKYIFLTKLQWVDAFKTLTILFT